MKIMNRYVALVLTINFAVVYCVKLEFAQTLLFDMRVCHSESYASNAEMQKIREEGVVLETASAEAFAVCMLKKWNVLNEDGSINKDVKTYAIIYPDNPEHISIASECKALATQNVSETARKVMKCLMKIRIQ